MTGTLAASVKTPITSILLAVEMSGTLTHMLPVAAVAFIALLVSDLLRTKPIYGELLERYVRAPAAARHADGDRKPCGQRHYGTAIGNGGDCGRQAGA